MAHAKRGKHIERKGIHFRSAWEANVGLIFDLWVDKGILSSWEYEPTVYNFSEWYGSREKPGPLTYTPDMKLIFADGHTVYVEVKGYGKGVDRTKIRRYRKHYGTYPLIIVTDDKGMVEFAGKGGYERWSYRELTKKYKPILDGWM
jgi:hypothetical protein